MISFLHLRDYLYLTAGEIVLKKQNCSYLEPVEKSKQEDKFSCLLEKIVESPRHKMRQKNSKTTAI